MSNNRKPWQYHGCEIVPQEGEARYFGHPHFQPNAGFPLYYTKWWRINFPNGTHILSATKESCMEYIDSSRGQAQGGLATDLSSQAMAA